LADLIRVDGGSMAQYNYGPKVERVSKIAAEVATYNYWVVGEKVSGLRKLDNDE
jgi:hypothetical protein